LQYSTGYDVSIIASNARTDMYMCAYMYVHMFTHVYTYMCTYMYINK